MVFLVRNDYSAQITVVSIGFVMFDVMFDLDSKFYRGAIVAVQKTERSVIRFRMRPCYKSGRIIVEWC